MLCAIGSHVSEAAASAPIRPVLGDWEGRGPLGLRLSFAFVKHGNKTVVRDMALGLPTGCRSSGQASWTVATEPKLEYAAPGSKLHAPFKALGAKQFFFLLPPTTKSRYPAEIDGTFSDARHGALSIPSPTTVGCTSTGWPKTLRFSLAASRRVSVRDGLWTGSLTTAQTSGTVAIRVIGGGRIETDFKVAFTCPSGSGTFELGPLATVGIPIEANGAIDESPTTETVFGGTFGASGTLRGTIASPGCSQQIDKLSFVATRTAS